MAFIKGLIKGRGDAEIIDIVTIFVTGSYLVNPLTNHLDQRLFRVGRWPQVFQSILHEVDDPETIPETIVNLSHQEKTNVRGDLGPLEIYPDGPVKIRPDYLFWAFTTSEHLGGPTICQTILK
jgi:hypothetical protein